MENFYERQTLQQKQCDERSKTTAVDYQETWVRGLALPSVGTLSYFWEFFYLKTITGWCLFEASSKDHNYVVLFHKTSTKVLHDNSRDFGLSGYLNLRGGWTVQSYNCKKLVSSQEKRITHKTAASSTLPIQYPEYQIFSKIIISTQFYSTPNFLTHTCL